MTISWAARELSDGTNVINKVDFKNQYHYRYGHEHEKYNRTNLTEYNKKPLEKSASAQVSFRGLNFTFKNNYVIKKIPKSLTQKVFDSLEKVSDQQLSYYKKIREEYVYLVKTSREFRRKYGFSEELAEKISEENLYYRPKMKLLENFFSNVIKPITALYKGTKKLLASQHSTKTQIQKKHEQVFNEFGSLEGLINSHEIWENGYRSMSGHGRWTEDSEFLIPNDVLLSKIKRRRNKVVDPDKGKYSTTSLMLGNRFISGMVYAYFLGTDAYNTTMRYSNNKTEASNQRKSRVAQEFSRIGLNMYIQNLLFGTFEAAVNKSLSTAMFVSGSTVAFSEILGRRLVGKPIMPSDKETLDRLEKEMDTKKGVLPAVGRMLTRVKKKDSSKTQNYKYTEANTKVFSQFSGKQAAPSFKGFYSSARLFEKKQLAELLQIIKQADEKQFEYIKSNIVKSVKKSKLLNSILEKAKTTKPSEYKELSFLEIINLNKREDIDKAYEIILRCESLGEIPLGTRKNFVGQLTKSILVPFHFIVNIGKSVKNFAVDLYNRFTSKQLSASISKMEKTLADSKFKEARGFKNFYEQRSALKVWKESNFSETEKKVKIFEEYMDTLSKEPEEIEGLKNILLWIDKQLTKSGIKIPEDGKLNPQDISKVQKIMKSSVIKADSAKHVEYDGNKLSQTNINLARAITTLFLVTDAYNLTMQYSNDNKKDANKSAKNRAAQEISRISFSAYLLAFVHNLLSKLCNSSLAGAFGLTALTSIINDSISRTVVGVPLQPKSQKELKEIDEKNAMSKSPIKKALAYSIGKKTAQTAPIQNYFSNEFFINPGI